jgi:hypothetical protein
VALRPPLVAWTATATLARLRTQNLGIYDIEFSERSKTLNLFSILFGGGEGGPVRCDVARIDLALSSS